MTPHERRLANLRPPWKKGESGNPEGRKEGSRNRATIVREWLECEATDGEGGTKADQITRAQIIKADAGDTIAFREIMDSAYGKNTEIQEIKQTGDLNINITRRVVTMPPADKSANGN